MNQEVSIYKFSDMDCRIIKDQQGDPWFVANDVCNALKLSNPRKALSSLDEDEKGVTIGYTPGGEQSMNTVSEAGLYALTCRSRKPVARQFRRWVTHEVIPAIRKRGYYYNYPVAGGIDQSAGLVLGLAKHLVTLEQRIDKLEEKDKRVAVIPATIRPVSTRTRLVQLIRGYVETNQKSYTEVWQKLYEEFKMRYHCDLSQRTANSRNRSGLDIAEKLGVVEDLYTLAKFLFVESN
jgi:prophage antirepressor-like protein